MLQMLNRMLGRRGYEVETAEDGAEALEKLEKLPTDVIISDVKMPKMDGLELLKRAKARYPDVELILLTGYGTIESAVDAMKQGAYDYITKPPNPDEILLTIKRITENRQLKDMNRALLRELSASAEDIGMVGDHPTMVEVYRMIERVAATDSTVLIYGESGTGKELVAKAIHARSNRAKYPFVVVNCAAISPELLENELFGHERGAYTDARDKRLGKFEVAHRGTLFMDEIGTMSHALQQRLLRAVEDKSFERVGGTETINVDVRIVAATNADLMGMVRDKTFREDLYYRLDVVRIDLPPLRERPSDIPPLAHHLALKHAPKAHRKVTGISEDALEALRSYHFPGNVRELENVIERALVLGNLDTITLQDLPADVRNSTGPFFAGGEDLGLIERLNEVERKMILDTLRTYTGNQSHAAKALKINRTTLIAKMKKYGLT